MDSPLSQINLAFSTDFRVPLGVFHLQKITALIDKAPYFRGLAIATAEAELDSRTVSLLRSLGGMRVLCYTHLGL